MSALTEATTTAQCGVRPRGGREGEREREEGGGRERREGGGGRDRGEGGREGGREREREENEETFVKYLLLYTNHLLGI